jgi:uncharacterized protein YeaO (DUF488 family)
MIRIQRVYDEPGSHDTYRVLIDRLWPRGLRKSVLHYDLWAKDVAPSPKLRQWFGHDPKKWDEFCRRYRQELVEHPDVADPLLAAAARGDVTLLIAARDPDHNHALVLKSYLEKRLAGRKAAGRRQGKA